ncbi:MAG TPA: Gfo/Idh/MocA family oxidoreductase [Acidobacteriota bacterium]|nr:Gfo/Idh/MocA family oxidoreductase [Acidobacteriota bacterium]
MDRRSFVGLAGAAGLGARFGTGLAGQNQPKIHLALVGCAHIHTPSFVQLLKARPDVVVKYIWDHEAARAARWAAELESRAVDNLNEIWNDFQTTAVVICSETNRHSDLVFQAARAGKHMFVEKPLGVTGKESLAMAEAIEKAKVKFTTGYFQRCLPVNLFLKEQVQKGNFGTITRVRGSNCHSGSLGGWFDKEWRWMADPKIAGVGAFGDLGTHLLDLLMWFMGDVEWVTADIKVVTGRYPGCDESGEALFRFKNGATATLAAGWVDVADPVSLLISGTEGHAAVINGQLFYQTNKIEGADGKKPWTSLPKGYPVPLDMFVDSLAGQGDLPLVSAREAAARVVVMEAMYQSSKDRKRVKLA